MQFVTLYEKVNFPEAVEILAKRLGLEIPYQKQDGINSKLKTNISDVAAEASVFFHQNLLEDKNAKGALAYLLNRGISLDTIKQFRIGYAPGRNTLLDYFRKKNFTIDILEKASLIVSRQESFHDMFNDRVMFPIFDVRGKVLGFGGRIWKDIKEAPKYINSPESPLYSKREHLFGLNFSKDEIIKQDCIIVVEGYLDMIVPYAAGIKNIAASLGTALTPEQAHLIRRYTSHVVLAYDSDKAGQAATLRALDLLLENELKVKVVKLPQGFDPDSLVRKEGRDCFARLIAQREDFFDYKIGVLKNAHDAESIEGKTKITQEIFSTLANLKSEIERYEYIRKLSQALRIKEEIMIDEWRRSHGAKSKNNTYLKSPGTMYKGTKELMPLTEKIIFKFMLNNKKAFPFIKKNLTETDFSSHLARKAASYFFSSGSPDALAAPENLVSGIQDKDLSSFISSIIMDEDIPFDKESFKGSILKLRKNRMSDLRRKVKDQIGEAEAKGDRGKLEDLIAKHDSINKELR